MAWIIWLGNAWFPLEPTASTEAERIWRAGRDGEYVRSNLFTAGSIIFIDVPSMKILYGSIAYTIARMGQ